MPVDRKITGDKFTITLPKIWRDSHELSPGQYLTPFFKDGSPLILVPREMELSDIEQTIIEILTKLRFIKDARELAESLSKIVKGITGLSHAE